MRQERPARSASPGAACRLSEDGFELEAFGSVDGKGEITVAVLLSQFGVGTRERIVGDRVARVTVEDTVHLAWLKNDAFPAPVPGTFDFQCAG